MSKVKKSFYINGTQSSVELEPEYWEALQTIANIKKKTLSKLICDAKSTNTEHNFSSYLRVLALYWTKN